MTSTAAQWSTVSAVILLLCSFLVSPTVGFSSCTRITDHGALSRIYHTTQSSDDVREESGLNIRDSFNLVVLGDLHLEDDMTAHEQARQDCMDALKQLSLLPSGGEASSSSRLSTGTTVEEMLEKIRDVKAGDLSVEELEILLSYRREGDWMKCFMVSLGDLGRKDIRHEPGDAGTTKSFQDAKAFLDGFQIPYELVSGNHDLEGLDEFDTDQANLEAWLRCFSKPHPQFSRQIGEKTLLVGVSTVRFRDAPYSSHEVHINDEQIAWFEQIVRDHPAQDGWKIIVFSHAPIMGSGLRVLQNIHIINGCAWLNHCSPDSRGKFLQIVRDNPQIKAWFSGHFHLSHEFEDSISTVGSCSFVQVGVMGPVSTRDGNRQTRIVQGCADALRIYTVNHHIHDEVTNRAQIRLDATIDLVEDRVTLAADANSDRVQRSDDWFQAYVPREEDGCYIESPDGLVADADDKDSQVCCWWHMADGAVLGLHEGQLVEYDADTLSPLGIVINKKGLGDRQVLVVEEGTAVVLVDEASPEDIEVVHPNDDGSYWRKFQRNKKVRQDEKAREAAARMWLERKQ